MLVNNKKAPSPSGKQPFINTNKAQKNNTQPIRDDILILKKSLFQLYLKGVFTPIQVKQVIKLLNLEEV